MSTPIGTWTFGQVISDIRTRLKSFTDEIFPKKLIRAEINRCISELHEIGGIKDDPIYRSNAIIPQSMSFTALPGATGMSYTALTRTLVIPAALSGYITWTGCTGFTSDWVGMPIRILDEVHGIQYITSIATVSNGTTVILADDDTAPVKDLTKDEMTVNGAVSTGTANEIVISNLQDYKIIDKITAIEDSTTGLCLEFSQKDFMSIKQYGSDSNYVDDILWYREGERIHFLKGNNITNYGVRTMFYTRMPIKGVLDADYVDVKDSNTGLIIEMVMLKILQSINAPIPQALSGANEKIMLMKKANAEEMAKQMSNAKTQ